MLSSTPIDQNTVRIVVDFDTYEKAELHEAFVVGRYGNAIIWSEIREIDGRFQYIRHQKA